MPHLDPTSIIAERELIFEPSIERPSSPRRSSTPRVSVRFRLGRPSQGPTDWYCPFEVEGFGETRVEAAHGSDSVQALLLAMAKLRVILAAMALQHKGHLRFAGGSGCGIPSLFEDNAYEDHIDFPSVISNKG